jgi:glutathione S-transferase
MSTNSLRPLTLHAHSTGPNPYKVAILLEALNVAYTVKLWDFSSSSAGVKGPEFTAVNYVLRVYDSSNKFGPKEAEGEKAKAEFDAWTSFLVSTLGPMMGQCNWFRHYHDQKNEDAYKRYEAQVYRCFGVLEQQVKGHGGKWILAGEGQTAVDFHFEPWMRQVEFAGLSLEKYPNLKAWVGRVQELAEVVRAYKTIGEAEEGK